MLRRSRYLFRKLLGGVLCLHENGWTYTWYHGWVKVGRRLLRYGTRRLPYREVLRKTTHAQNVYAPTYFAHSPRSSGGRTVALFALYAPDGNVPETVWLYLEGLRKIADEVVVVSDGAISTNDVERMSTVASCGIFKHHGEYDFGSYARAYVLAEANGHLLDCDRLIMANDSCVAPVVPFGEMMQRMSLAYCDFWGQTSYSFHGRPHVQSYFMTFSKSIITSGVLGEFFKALPVCKTRADVISSCEIALTEYLVANGFKWSSYVPYRAVLKNPTCSPVSLMEKYACPLVKIKALCGETFEPVAEARTVLGRINPKVYEAFLRIADEWEPVLGTEMLYD